VQSSLSARAHQKLAFKYFGPFSVLQHIGKVAYKLELPASASIHPVFHVSQLKQTVGDQVVSSTLHGDQVAFSIPERVLQRHVAAGDHPVLQGLIKWSGMPVSLATWEDLEALHQRFPLAPTWGQVGSQEEGGVSSSGPQEIGPRTRRPNSKVISPEWSN
jgi:hypothetical protein